MPHSPESAMHSGASRSNGKAHKRLRVLIVDDDPLSRELLTDCLEPLGLNVDQAHDGVEALSVMQQAQPDLMLVDIQMPRMDGFELLRHLRDHDETRHIPVFAISAFAMAGDAERALAKGFNHYITKPVALSKLRKLVESTLRPTRNSN